MFNEKLSGVAEFDESTGLGVAWIRDEPPREETSHFVLIIEGNKFPFSASYIGGVGLIMRERPELSASEAVNASRADKRILFEASNIGQEFDEQTFVEIWHRLLEKAFPQHGIIVAYRSGNILRNEIQREWRFER